jgi:exodeoxyribonuclease V beta subunit
VNQERLSEQRRLLYVALTRPIFKLYVPKVKITSRNRTWAGPVGTILLPALEQACPDKLGPLIADVVMPPLAVTAPRPDETAAAKTAAAPKAAFTIAGPLFPPIDANIGKRRIVIRSFSSMARHHLAHLGDGPSFGDQPNPIEDETAAPIDHEDPLRGPVFGDMVHNVLEEIDFAEVARTPAPDGLTRAGAHARKLIDVQIRANIAKVRTRTPPEQLEQAARQQIAHLVWAALHTPLTELGGPLCRIPKSDRIAEVEFIFPERAGPTQPADLRWEDGFVTGFMDLLFRKDAKYYLLDWKTNLLASYQREAIERSMADSDYHRQYRLYLQAIARWLRRMHGPKWDFLEHFGGVFYLYVRGLNGRDDSTGVFFHRPTARELDLDSVLK